MKNVQLDFYSAVGVDVDIYSDTGGLFYICPNDHTRKSIVSNDKRIRELRIDGIKLK